MWNFLIFISRIEFSISKRSFGCFDKNIYKRKTNKSLVISFYQNLLNEIIHCFSIYCINLHGLRG